MNCFFRFLVRTFSNGHSIASGLVITVFTFTLAIQAQTNIPLKDSVSLDEVLVTAGRYPQSLRSLAAPVQVVGNSRLQLNPTGDLSSALASVPGVQLQSGTAQTLKLTIRGIGSRSQYGTNRTRAYLNDIPLTGGDGTSVFDDLELSFMERAEITKGSYSAWYGGGMGGAVRFKTRSISDEPTETSIYNNHLNDRGFALSSADASVTAGSFGLLKYSGSASVGYSSGKLMAGVARLSGDGFRDNSAYERTSGLLTGEQSLSKFGMLSYLLLLSDVKAYTPSSVDENTFRNSPESAAPNWLAVNGFKEYQRMLAGLRLETPLQARWMNTFLLTANRYDQYELRPFNILDDESVTVSFQESVRYTSPALTAAIGVEGLMERYSWQTQANATHAILTDAQELRSHLNAFVSMELKPVEQLRISLAANINLTAYQLKHQLPAVSSDHLAGKPIVSPMTGIVFHLTDGLSFYGSAGHGFSNPTVEESLGSDGLMNAALRPEQGWTVDAGIKSWFFNSKLAVQASVYMIFLDDLLVTMRPAEDVFYGANAGSSLLKGLEGTLRYRPFPWLNYSLSASFSENRFRSFTDEGVDYSGKHLPGIPGTQVYSELMAELPLHLQFNVVYRYTGSQFADDANSVEVGDWSTFDLGLRYDAPLAGKLRFHASVSAHNIFDEKYASMILINAPSFAGRAPRYYYPALPRNFAVKVQLKW